MANIKIIYDEDRLTVGDILDLEEGQSAKTTFGILSKCVINGSGEYMSAEDGLQVIRDLSLAEFKTVVEKFKSAAKADPK